MNLDRYKIISFDIFDTLIDRGVYFPKDVFYIAGVLARQEHITDLPPMKYALLRRDSEVKARIAAPEGVHDITIDDIYRVIQKKTGCSKESRERLKEIEKDVEMQVVTANPQGQKMYRQAMQEGKRVILTTDMYLPKDTIRALVQLCGYDDMAAVYVSGEVGKPKATGELFQYVLSQEEAEPGEILHIGDNRHSDYDMAKGAGFEAEHVDNKPDTSRCGGKLKDRADMEKITDKRIRKIIEEAEEDMRELDKPNKMLLLQLKIRRKIKK